MASGAVSCSCWEGGGGKVSHKARADTDGWEGTDYNLKSMFVYVCGKKVQNLFISGVEFIVVRLLLSL